MAPAADHNDIAVVAPCVAAAAASAPAAAAEFVAAVGLLLYNGHQKLRSPPFDIPFGSESRRGPTSPEGHAVCCLPAIDSWH